jgi:hypothetical protein
MCSLKVRLPKLARTTEYEYYVQITPQEVARPFWVTLSYLPAVIKAKEDSGAEIILLHHDPTY